MNESLLERLRFCASLPTPPSTAVRVIELANSPTTSMAQISDCIGFDPALAAKVLKVANSPLYSTNRSAKNIRQAVNLMGTHAAITIALSFSLVRRVSTPGAQDDHLYWKRAVLSAVACRMLAERFGYNPHDLLLAGLLQDIGILALRATLPEEYAGLETITDHEELLHAERKRFGSGHDEVGYWLLKKWRLPDHLALACLTSHAASYSDEPYATPEHCVAVSGYFADVFLRSPNAEFIQQAAVMAYRRLGMDNEATLHVLQEMGNTLEEFGNLFDLKLIDANQVDAILDEAKELIVIANLGRLRGLEEKTMRDTLTGAHNRAYLDDAFKQEFAAATKHGWPLAIAFIDIDHFKAVNDTYGHAAGDSTLIALSRLVMSQIRDGDIFVRYAGDEFLLIFPGTPASAALNVLSRIRENISSSPHIFGDHTFHITISVGLAGHMGKETRYSTPADMLHAADAALYQAKQQGRNRIVMAGE